MSALLATLPESGRAARARRSPAGVAASVVLHAAVITLAVWATVDAHPGPDDVLAVKHDTLIYIFPTDPDQHPPTHEGHSVRGGPGAPSPRPRGLPTPSVPTLQIQTGEVPTSPVAAPGPIVDEFGTGRVASGDPSGIGGPASGDVWSARQVEVPAALLPGGPVPRYPETLRAAGTTGSVVVQFVVDTTGRVERGTLRVVSSGDALFTAAVRAVLPSLRLSPARANGGRVRQLVELPFEFALGR